MIRVLNYEGKTEEEAIEKALKELKLNRENIITKSEYIEGKLFKSSKYIISIIIKEEIINYIKQYIKVIADKINISIDCDITIVEDNFNITLVSDNNSILIGKEGRTLNAIQLLIRQSIKNQTSLNIKLNIDAANYKLKKLKNIEYQIKKIANEILETKIDVSLDSMNSYERRLVHSIINEYPSLETESIGEGKDRHIVIKYIEK